MPRKNLVVKYETLHFAQGDRGGGHSEKGVARRRISHLSFIIILYNSLMDKKQYYVYILANKLNTVLYTGITNNIKRRVYEHKNKLVKGFTKTYNVDKLVYYEVFDDPYNAISREKKIKGWIRKKKVELINSFNPTWKDLYDEII